MRRSSLIATLPVLLALASGAAQAHALLELGVSAGDAKLIFGENLERLRNGAG